MLIEQFRIIRAEDHVARRDDHIRIRRFLDGLHVEHIRTDVAVIGAVRAHVLRGQDMQLPAFGIDVVMTSCAQMLDQRTRVGLDINLDAVHAAVAQVRDREVDHAVTAQKGECGDRTIILHALDQDIWSFIVYDSECFTHNYSLLTLLLISSIFSLLGSPTIAPASIFTPSATIAR